jgi:hypothetical protein
MREYKYYLKPDWQTEWTEVTKEEFVKAERAAGFRNTMGEPNEPATSGFSGHGMNGRKRYSPEDGQ